MKRNVVGLLIAAAVFGGCEDDNGTDVEVPVEFEVVIENVSEGFAYPASGAFTVPAGAEEAGVIGPGDAYEFVVPGLPGDRLSFATMFVQSNDFFYAPAEAGIALYDGNGDPISGDVTAQVLLWDAGTEVNQEPGLGEDQAPRQEGGNTGDADADDNVRAAPDAFGNLPAVADVMEVTITPNDDNTFTVRIENVSTDATLSTSDGGSVAVPLSPGVWVIHDTDGPLFTSGAPGTEALELLAEDGVASGMADALAAETGITTPLAPGVWAIVDGGAPFFNYNTEASAGLEALAEDGDPSALVTAVGGHSAVRTAAVFNTPVGATAPAPLMPGESYSFTFEATRGEQVQLATMYVESNDTFYAFSPGGFILFDAVGPVTEDVTGSLRLWDAGTEVNQWPGFGPDQAPRQAAANTGAAEDGVVAEVDDDYSYGSIEDVIRVTITALDESQLTN